MSTSIAVQNCLFAVDISGSVGGAQLYWSVVKKIWTQVLNNYHEKNIQIVLWDDKSVVVSKSTLENWIEKRKGCGGTDPHHIALSASSLKFHGDLIVLTDGDVSQSSVEQLDNLIAMAQTSMTNDSFGFHSVECHIIGSGNMSVTAPFTRNCPSEVWCYHPTVPDGNKVLSLSAQDFHLLDNLQTIQTYSEFKTKQENLESLLLARNMGRPGLPVVREELLKMRSRIVHDISQTQNFKADALVLALTPGDKQSYQQAVIEIRRMSAEYYGENDTSVFEKQMSYLVNLCGDLRGQYDKNSIRTSRAARASNVEEKKINEIKQEPSQDPEALVSDHLIDCPIMLDMDVPVIMIKTGTPILHGETGANGVLTSIDPKLVDSFTDNPLNILLHPGLVQAIKDRFDVYVGLQPMREGGGFAISPFTRQPILGGLALGKHMDHVKASDWTMARLMTGGKLLGNLDLWFVALREIIKTVPRLSDVTKNIDEHIIYRMQHRSTFASLTGLSQYVTTRIPLGCALWYIVHSPEVKLPPKQDIFRTHIRHVSIYQELLQLLAYPMSEAIQKHSVRVSVMLHMLFSVKTSKHFQLTLKALYQNAILIDSDETKISQISERVKDLEGVYPLVLLDGAASQEQQQTIRGRFPSFYSSLSNEELYHLGQLVDPSKSAGDIEVFLDWQANALPVHVKSWLYSEDTEEKNQHQIVPVCPTTMRPFYYVKDMKQKTIQTWKQAAEDQFHVPVDKQFSKFEKFINFVAKYEKYPTFEEWLIYCFNRYCVYGKYATLPKYIAQYWHTMMQEYTKIIGTIQPSEFIVQAMNSREIKNRIRLEGCSNE